MGGGCGGGGGRTARSGSSKLLHHAATHCWCTTGSEAWLGVRAVRYHHLHNTLQA